MNTDERNNFAWKFTEGKLDRADSLSIEDFEGLNNLDDLVVILDDLINTKVAGFRGIVATAITGLEIDDEYDPINNFYGCKPRALFEKGIVKAFRNRIPSGKSDPLNVAKNVDSLDDGWVKGKRPEKSARAAVDYIAEIISSTGEYRNLIIDLFYFKLVEFARSVSSIKIEAPDTDSISGNDLSYILNRMIIEFPESGTVPQYLIYKLLDAVLSGAEVEVVGGLDSVFGTNTTSKKPADIWLVRNGITSVLYEITVKTVDYKRLDDCFDNLSAMNVLNIPTYFICRLPENVSGIELSADNNIVVQNKNFGFIDIGELVRSLVVFLSEGQIILLLSDIESFMTETARQIKTKNGWNSIVSSINDK